MQIDGNKCMVGVSVVGMRDVHNINVFETKRIFSAGITFRRIFIFYFAVTTANKST
jgi:hypothetical protein